jgi:hypothetical protein
MPRVVWPLRHGQPAVDIVLTLAAGGQPIMRTLLADTGAGSSQSAFELILDEDDCLLCAGTAAVASIGLGGAYLGNFPLYTIFVQIPALNFAATLRAVGVPAVPPGVDGIANFRFLNSFTYGNFGDPTQFGLEC